MADLSVIRDGLEAIKSLQDCFELLFKCFWISRWRTINCFLINFLIQVFTELKFTLSVFRIRVLVKRFDIFSVMQMGVLK